MPFANFVGRRGINHTSAKMKSPLLFTELWDEEEEVEGTSLPWMGIRELIIAEDSSPFMEDIFGDLHLEGHQTSTASPEAT